MQETDRNNLDMEDTNQATKFEYPKKRVALDEPPFKKTMSRYQHFSYKSIHSMAPPPGRYRPKLLKK